MRVNKEQITTPPDGKAMDQQPEWRRDFPIDTPQDNYVARRDFTKFLVLTSGAFAVGQVWIAGKTMMSRGEGKAAARKVGVLSQVPVGGAMTFDYPAEHDACILLRTGEREVLAYSQKCTHLSCAVVPDRERNCLHCPCHEGNFEISTGRPISGPPQRPLPRIVVELRGEDIWATGVEERMV
jgi:nitrite reductase/ring-hydroxylating ferredoxin subunit